MKKKIVIVFGFCICLISGLFVIFNFLLIQKKYINYVVKYSDEYNLDKSLVYAIIKVESNFDHNATSSAGAMGLMQIIPTTAKWIADELNYDYKQVDLYNPETNINFGCFYLKYLQNKFDDIEIIICAYNAGETVVKNWLDENGKLDTSKITYPETLNYYKKVMKYFNIYSKNEIGV